MEMRSPSSGGSIRRYRGESNIVFDMDPPDFHITPLSKQKKNADFAAKIEREGFSETRASRRVEYGIGTGPRTKRPVDTTASRCQLGGGARCAVVGFDHEFADHAPGGELRWEYVNDDFLGESRSSMLPYKPKFRAIAGYTPQPDKQYALFRSATPPSGKMRTEGQNSVHQSKVVFAAPGDGFFYHHDQQQQEEPAGPSRRGGSVVGASRPISERADKAMLSRFIQSDVAAEYSHPTPKRDFYLWESPNFKSSTYGGHPYDSNVVTRQQQRSQTPPTGSVRTASPHYNNTPTRQQQQQQQQHAASAYLSHATEMEGYQHYNQHSNGSVQANALLAAGASPSSPAPAAEQLQSWAYNRVAGTHTEETHRHLSSYQLQNGVAQARAGMPGGMASGVGKRGSSPWIPHPTATPFRHSKYQQHYNDPNSMQQPSHASNTSVNTGGGRATTPLRNFSGGVAEAMGAGGESSFFSPIHQRRSNTPNARSPFVTANNNTNNTASSSTPQQRTQQQQQRAVTPNHGYTAGGGGGDNQRAASGGGGASPSASSRLPHYAHHRGVLPTDLPPAGFPSYNTSGATPSVTSTVVSHSDRAREPAQQKYMEQYHELKRQQQQRHAELQASIYRFNLGSGTSEPSASSVAPSEGVAPGGDASGQQQSGGDEEGFSPALAAAGTSPSQNNKSSQQQQQQQQQGNSALLQFRASRKIVQNAPTSNTYRVLHVGLQDEPEPWRPSLRTGIAPTPELEKDPKTLPRERPSDIFNLRYTGR